MAISIKLSGNTSSSHYSLSSGALTCSTNSSTSATYRESFKVYLNDSKYGSCNISSGSISVSQEKATPTSEDWCIELINMTSYANIRVQSSVTYTNPNGTTQTDYYVIYEVEKDSYKDIHPGIHVEDGSYCFEVKSGTTPRFSFLIEPGIRYNDIWNNTNPEGTISSSTEEIDSQKIFKITLEED